MKHNQHYQADLEPGDLVRIIRPGQPWHNHLGRLEEFEAFGLPPNRKKGWRIQLIDYPQRCYATVSEIRKCE